MARVEKIGNQETKEPINFSSKGVPSTHQHTDSHLILASFNVTSFFLLCQIWGPIRPRFGPHFLNHYCVFLNCNGWARRRGSMRFAAQGVHFTIRLGQKRNDCIVCLWVRHEIFEGDLHERAPRPENKEICAKLLMNRYLIPRCLMPA